MKRLKSGTWFGIAMAVVFLIALGSAVFSRMSMERYLDEGPPPGSTPAEASE